MSSPPKRSVPLVGSSSRTSSRPSVDLPQPDSPTIPSVSPRRTSSDTPSTAWTTSDELRLDRARPHREVLDEVDRLEQDAVRAHAVFLRRAGRTAGSRWQASRRPGSTRSASSGLVEQSSKRYGQRGSKRQPGGGASGDGGAPGMPVSRLHARPAEPRDRVEQPPRVRVLRVAEHGALRPLLDDAAGVHDDDPLGELRHDAHVVRDQHDRRVVLALQPLHQRQDLRLDRHVEGRRRLVGDQQRRVARERHRDHHALPHAARELVRVVVDPSRRVRDPDLGHQLDRARVRLAPRQRLVRTQLLLDLPADGVHRRQRGQRVLEDHRDLAAAHVAHLLLAELHQVAAAVEHLPLDDRVRIADQPHHGEHRDGLAGARLADDAEHLAECDRERDARRPRARAPLSVLKETLRSRTSSSGSGMTDARVEQRVDEVDGRVDDDDEERRVDDRRHDHRQVELLQRLIRQPADARAG